jgi:hypothetical protein
MTLPEQAAFGSLAISILALVNSLRSNRISSSALEMAKQAFFGERRIALKSERVSDHLLLSATVDGQTLHSITMYFPTKLGIAPFALGPPDFKLWDNKIATPVRTYWDSMTTPGSERANVPMPVVAVVQGYTKGVATLTIGIYDLFTRYVRPDKNSSSLSINALTIHNYAMPTDKPQKLVDSLLATIEKSVLTNSSPVN